MSLEQIKEEIINFTRSHYNGEINGYEHALRLLENKDGYYPKEVEDLINLLKESENNYG